MKDACEDFGLNNCKAQHPSPGMRKARVVGGGGGLAHASEGL